MKNMFQSLNGGAFASKLSGLVLIALAALTFAILVWTAPAHAQVAPSGDTTIDGAPPDDKCTICHLPPGNPSNAQTLTIGCSAVDAHMRNHPGDCMGPCPCQPTPVTNP
jgi:hypothetical protein